jgi:hypothetical protein
MGFTNSKAEIEGYHEPKHQQITSLMGRGSCSYPLFEMEEKFYTYKGAKDPASSREET